MIDPAITVSLITTAGAIAVAVIGHRRMKRQDSHLEAVRYQVQNSHETNLREDIDKVLSGIKALQAGQRRHDREIAGLRSEMRTEREERLALANRLDHADR